ncbi:MAG: outer membrane beta-barrel protein [Chitinophagales bacterium]
MLLKNSSSTLEKSSTANSRFKVYLIHCVLFASLLVLFPTLSQAQLNMPGHENKNLHFGIAVGLNWSNFKVTHSEDFINHDTILVVESPRSPGFNVGIISDLHIGKRADLRFIPTLIFMEKDLIYDEKFASEVVETPQTIESITLSFPLYFKYKSDRFFNNFRFYVLGGVRFDWDLGSNSKARKAFDIIKLDRYDAAVEYGFGLEFYFPLFIFSPEIKFTSGLPNIHVPTDGLRYSNILQKLQSRGVTFTLQFEG